MKELPKIVVDKNGYLRLKMPSGEMLPEVELKIQNNVKTDSEKSNRTCYVTITFLAEHNLK